MSDGEPPLSGFAEIGADLVEGFALSVATRERRDGSRVASSVGFRANDCRENNGDIDGDGQGWGSRVAHDRVPPIPVVYRGADTRSRA